MTSKLKIGNVDRLANVTYSLFVGAAIDAASGASALEVLVSRASATGINAATGGWYGWWREKMCSYTGTTQESGPLRKGVSDLLAFCTFQIPLYALVRTTGGAIGELTGKGELDVTEILSGMGLLAAFSPLIGPTLGIYTDTVRRLFGIKSAAEGAYSEINKE
ncbi:MAG: L-alanine exporter AlaE [Nanoarchaeota archaeon]|nr:L-alanine exporter AlaE [Nanoarchaeota archaeon]